MYTNINAQIGLLINRPIVLTWLLFCFKLSVRVLILKIDLFLVWAAHSVGVCLTLYLRGLNLCKAKS
jgi:hypothetical protein